MKKIGIYGGTFDPIHHGHLILAREAREQLGLAQIIFVPAGVSPHKMERAPAPGDARMEMLKAAIENDDAFGVTDLELRRPPPSYTIDTVQEISAREPDCELYYLVGEDNVAKLDTWHRFEELQKLVQFAVLDRTGAGVEHQYPVVCRRIDISGSDIRKKVASGLPIRYLVPPAVEEIIHRRNLYREPAK